MGSPDRGSKTKKLAIAFYCWAKGYFAKDKLEYFPNLGPNDKEGVITVGERIPRRTFPDYCNDDFWEAVQIWRDFQTFGFPEDGGTNSQPALWLDVVRLMSACAKKMKVT